MNNIEETIKNLPVANNGKGKQPLFLKHPKRAVRFIESIRKGNYVTVSCKASGISRTAYHEWQEKAGKGISPYKEFIELVEQAESEFIEDSIDEIREAGHKNWQALAWILERRHQDKYGRYERVEEKKDLTIDININGVERKEAQELMRNGKTIEVIPNETRVEPK